MTEADFQKLKMARGVDAITIIEDLTWKAADASSVEEANSLEEFAQRLFLEASDHTTPGRVAEATYYAGQIRGLARMLRAKFGREVAIALGTAIARREECHQKKS